MSSKAFSIGRVGLATLILVGLGLGAVLAGPDLLTWGSLREPLSSIVGTVFATFLGAFVAFRSEEHRRQEAERSRRIEAVNQAVFQLASIANDFRQLKTVLWPRRNHAMAHLVVPGSVGALPTVPTFDFAGLGFLVVKHGQILGRMHVLRRCADSALTLLAERDDLRRRFVEPSIEKLSQRGLATPEEVDRDLPTMASQRLKVVTSNLLKLIEHTLEEATQLGNDLSEAWCKVYPDGQIVRFKLPDVPDIEDSLMQERAL